MWQQLCLNLIHRSAREHNARIDNLLRLPPEKFREVLAGGTIGQQLLAVQASTVLSQRLQKKARKYAKVVSNDKLGRRIQPSLGNNRQ
jgi:hypothetical protein